MRSGKCGVKEGIRCLIAVMRIEKGKLRWFDHADHAEVTNESGLTKQSIGMR